jgi:hypothetical protein
MFGFGFDFRSLKYQYLTLRVQTSEVVPKKVILIKASTFFTIRKEIFFLIADC